MHVGGTGDSPYRAAFQAVEAHTHTLQTVSCIVSRGPSHNLHSQTATVLMPFQYANFSFYGFLYSSFVYTYIYLAPRGSVKKKMCHRPLPPSSGASETTRKTIWRSKKKKGNRSGQTCDVRSYKVLSMHRLVHQKQHVLRTHTPGKTKKQMRT